jgi:hypothetical protein
MVSIARKRRRIEGLQALQIHDGYTIVLPL